MKNLYAVINIYIIITYLPISKVILANIFNLTMQINICVIIIYM